MTGGRRNGRHMASLHPQCQKLLIAATNMSPGVDIGHIYRWIYEKIVENKRGNWFWTEYSRILEYAWWWLSWSCDLIPSVAFSVPVTCFHDRDRTKEETVHFAFWDIYLCGAILLLPSLSFVCGAIVVNRNLSYSWSSRNIFAVLTTPSNSSLIMELTNNMQQLLQSLIYTSGNVENIKMYEIDFWE